MQIFCERVRKQDEQVCSALKYIAEKVVKEKSGCQNQLDLLGILHHALTIMENPNRSFPVGFYTYFYLNFNTINFITFLYVYENEVDDLSLFSLYSLLSLLSSSLSLNEIVIPYL